MDFKKINPKIIWMCLILISIGAIIFCIILIFNEIVEARRECNNIGGDYNLNFLQGHLCNSKRFIRYQSCQPIKYNQLVCNRIWTFEDTLNKANASEFVK